MEVSGLAEYISKALVDYPEQIVVRETQGKSNTILELVAHKADIGKVIGKKGVTIAALRVILSAAAAKERRRIIFELTE